MATPALRHVRPAGIGQRPVRRLYVHCGLHKTGTSALQATLHRNAQALRAAGVLYPETGIPPRRDGHHNIAWQLARDRRFDPGIGNVAALLSEINAFDGKVVVSSEDFESSLLHRERWIPLLEGARLIGIPVVFVVYLRDPMSYLESLYLEQLKHGFGEEYLTVARRICESGKLSLREWEFCFDYPRLQASLASLPETQLVFRSYERLHGGSIASDFAEVLQMGPASLQHAPEDFARNARMPLTDNLRLFLKNRMWLQTRERHVCDVVVQAAESFCSGGEMRPATPPRIRDSFAARFAESRRFLERLESSGEVPLRNDRPANSANEGATGCPVEVDISRVFSFETCLAILNAARALQRSEDAVGSIRREAFVQCERARWRSWIGASPDDRTALEGQAARMRVR